ncbi:MAG: Lrp/AsnC family transcriptional regulator [Dermatophilaceae bacterium]
MFTQVSRLHKPTSKDYVLDSLLAPPAVIYSALDVLEATPVNNVRRPVLDEIDHAILRLLAADGRMPNLALASAVGIAPSTCLGRVRALRESGIIRGYHADIDLTAVGLPIQAVIAVRMQAHHRDQIQAFVTLAPHLPGVVEVFHVAGGTDYLLHVATADTTALHDFILEYFAASPAIQHAETSLVFRHLRGTNVLPAD